MDYTQVIRMKESELCILVTIKKKFLKKAFMFIKIFDDSFTKY